jgi:hypothetical protein
MLKKRQLATKLLMCPRLFFIKKKMLKKTPLSLPKYVWYPEVSFILKTRKTFKKIHGFKYYAVIFVRNQVSLQKFIDCCELKIC